MKRDLDYVTKRMICRCRTMMQNSARWSKHYLGAYRKGGNIEDYAYSRECKGYAKACKEIREWLIEDFKRKEEMKRSPKEDASLADNKIDCLIHGYRMMSDIADTSAKKSLNDYGMGYEDGKAIAYRQIADCLEYLFKGNENPLRKLLDLNLAKRRRKGND